jgi:polyphosphate kinase
MDEVTLGLLVRELDISDQEVYRTAPRRSTSAGSSTSRGSTVPTCTTRSTCRRRTASCSPPSQPAGRHLRAVSRKDVLLHHPTSPFATSVQAFLEQAAADPDVLAIKQTLYRTSGDSPIVEALIDAAESGKQVLALVEIKARFDEAANITWARKLEKAGVHVVYGLVGLKTHCKLALVIRRRRAGCATTATSARATTTRRRAASTRTWGCLTADDQVGKDLTRLFNELSGTRSRRSSSGCSSRPCTCARGC